MVNDVWDRNCVIFVFYMFGEKYIVSNLVKDFILNFVNRKGFKKWSIIKWFVIMENVSDEKVLVRYVGRGYMFI